MVEFSFLKSISQTLKRMENNDIKSVGFVTVAVLLLEASRIALFMSEGNAEAHAKICNHFDISTERTYDPCIPT